MLYIITTTKGMVYKTLAHKGTLAGDAVSLACEAFLCPLSSIQKVELEGESVTTVLYDAKGEGYTFDDLERLPKKRG